MKNKKYIETQEAIGFKCAEWFQLNNMDHIILDSPEKLPESIGDCVFLRIW